MLENLQEMRYYELANRLTSCCRKLRNPKAEEVEMLSEMKRLLKEEQNRRMSRFFKPAVSE